MQATTVLLVGGEREFADLIRPLVTGVRSCRFEHVPGATAVAAKLEGGAIGLVLVYLRSDADTASALHLVQMLQAWPGLAVLALSEEFDPALTLQLMRLGVVECIACPEGLARLALLVDILTVRARYARSPTAVLPRHGSQVGDLDLNDFLGTSSSAQRLVGHIRRVATLDSTVLLTGETGTGKTAVARMIHNISPRAERPFLVINCGALSPTLIESEMFGHQRGAFTGADHNHVGKFEQVQDGTLLLDEIDSFPPFLQGKLLRAVEERVFEPVGSNESRPLRARLIAATNRVLEDEVSAGRFRPDLYFRLKVIDLVIPPLRDRQDVIPVLAQKYLAEFAMQNKQPEKGLSPVAEMALTAYHWPGNVRELHHAIERSAALCPRNLIELPDLPDEIQLCAAAEVEPAHDAPASPVNELARARSQAEQRCLQEALQRHRNNRSQAALDLGISRVTLYKKMHKHQLD